MSDNIKRVPLKDLSTFEGRAKHLYYIQDKDGVKRPFQFLQAQKYFNDIVEEEFKRTKREIGAAQCRIIALKPRQVGWTTYSEIKSLDMQLWNQGSNGVIVAHDNDTTEKVYWIYQRAYNNLPEKIIPTVDGKDLTSREFYEQILSEKQQQQLFNNEDVTSEELDRIHTIDVKPKTRSYTGKRIGFEETDSVTTIFTAGKGDAGGLGGTIKRAHMSEIANFPYFNDLMTSLNPSVPKFADDIFFILESTANGMTGEGEGMYNKWTTVTKEWESYQKGEHQSFFNFRPVFIPWYMFDEYELPLTGGKYEDISQIDFGSPEEKQKFLQREKEMMIEGVWNPLTKERQVLTPEKINWYRFIIKTDCEHDYKEAQRFYPTTPEDAFVASSNSFFDSTKLNEVKGYYLNNGEPEYDLGNLEWDDDNELTFVKDSVGSLKIFKYPEPNWENRYVIGADIARGYEDGDYSVAFVKDRLNQEYVALWFGKIDQDKFAETLTELGIYYNEALLVPEANLETVVELIKPDGRIPYIGEIYYREGGNQMRYGYWTDVSSRRTLMDEHKAWLRDNDKGYYALPDIATIDEHVSFVKKKTPNGVKYEADEGCHDDRVLSSALANKGDYWWDEDPEEYKPTKVMEFIRRPIKDRKKRKRQSQLGK